MITVWVSLGMTTGKMLFVSGKQQSLGGAIRKFKGFQTLFSCAKIDSLPSVFAM